MTRAVVLIVSGRIVTALLALAAFRLATAILTPEEFGLFAALMAFNALCGFLIVNPVGQYVTRQTHAWAASGELSVRMAGFGAYALVAALAAACLVIVWALWRAEPAGSATVWAASVAFVVAAATANGTLVPMLNMLGWRMESVFWGVLTHCVIVGASFLLAAYVAPTGASWLLGYGIGMAFGAFGAWVALGSRAGLQLRRPRPFIEREAIWSYCVPLAGATFFMAVQTNGYRLIIEPWWGLAALGFAAAGIGIANQIFVLCETIAAQVIHPSFFRRLSTNDTAAGYRAASDMLNLLGPFYLVVAAATLVAAPALLHIALDPSFATALAFAQVAFIAECCRVIGNLLALSAQVEKRTAPLILPQAGGAAVTVIGLALGGTVGLSLQQAILALVAGNATVLAALIARAYRQDILVLDPIRWVGGGAMLVLAAAFALAMPLRMDGLLDALALILHCGAAAAAGAGLVLWRNPALQQLLATPTERETSVVCPLKSGPP